MRGSIALLAFPLLAVAPPAHAGDRRPTADLRMTYENTEIARDNTSITWHWVLTNRGALGAEGVVATHRTSGGQRITAMSAPCAGEGGDAVCRFASVAPGQKLTGWIRTKITSTDQTLRLSGQLTWREISVVPPRLRGPGHAGSTPRTGSRPPRATDPGRPPVTDSGPNSGLPPATVPVAPPAADSGPPAADAGAPPQTDAGAPPQVGAGAISGTPVVPDIARPTPR